MACVAPAAPSTKETTNYARLCRLLVELGTRALKDTFDSIHAPATLHAVLVRNKTVLQSLRGKKVINPKQWGKLFPTNPSSVSSSSFDITLLMVLLRNICGLVAPATGWDALPTATDVSREADIARIKFFRNTVYAHAQHASVDDTTFNSQWRDIRESMVRLGGLQYRTAIDLLETECMDPSTEKKYTELLEQWKKDEDNVKDQLEEVMKKLHEITTEVKSLPEKILHGSNTFQERDHENEPVENFCEDCSKVCQKCGQISYNYHNKKDVQQEAFARKDEIAKVIDKLKAKAVYVEAKVNEQTDLMQKSLEEICSAERAMVEIVEEKIRVLNSHKRDLITKFSEIREAQQREHKTRIKTFKMVAAQTSKSIEKCEDFLKRMNGPGIPETEYAADLTRFEKGLNDEEMEIYLPRRVTYRAYKDSVTLGEIVELEPHFTAAPVQRTEAFQWHEEEVHITVSGRSKSGVGNKNEANYSKDGDKTAQHTPKTACAAHDVVVNRCEKPLSAWHRRLQINPHQNKGFRSFESSGKGHEMFHNPCRNSKDSEDGDKTVQHTPNAASVAHDVVVNRCEKPLTAWPRGLQMSPHQNKGLRTFRSCGKGKVVFHNPCSIAVSEKTGFIVVAEGLSNRVQLFDSEWKFLRTIGDKGTGAKIKGNPISVAFTASGNIVVVQSESSQRSRLSLFNELGHFITDISRHLIEPQSVSVRSDGKLLVCDWSDDAIKVLSPDGTKLMQTIKAPNCDESPWFAVHYQRMYFVSYDSAHCVKVFSDEGQLLYEIGSKGSREGQLKGPKGLVIDKRKNLVLCDNENNRLQIFSLDGKLLNSVAEEMKDPWSVAIAKNGDLLVCDFTEDCIHIMNYDV